MDRYDVWAYSGIYAILATITALRFRGNPESWVGTAFSTAAVLLFVIHFNVALGLAANP